MASLYFSWNGVVRAAFCILVLLDGRIKASIVTRMGCTA